MTTHGAKYGDSRYLYGDAGRLYGLDAPSNEIPDGLLQWIIMIDWTGNGWTGNEAPRCIGYHSPLRGREYYVRAGATSIEPMKYSPGTLTLDNYDHRYDPYNTSSPLYPNVNPGRKIYIAVKDLASGIIYPRLTGHITDIQPVSGPDPQVTVTFYDDEYALYNTGLNMPILLSTTAPDAIKEILVAANYAYGWDLQTWAQPIPVFDGTNINAYQAINDLASASLGTFFIDARGHARFFPLNYNSMAVHTIDQSDCLKVIPLSMPWDMVRNQLTVTAQRMGKYPESAIYSMSAPVLVPAHSWISFDVSWPDAAVDVGSRIQFIATAYPGGGGGDLTATVIVSLSNITATGCTVNAYESFGGFDAYLFSLTIYGCKLATSQVVFRAVSDNSQKKYGIRRFDLASPYLQDGGYAKAFSIILINFLREAHRNPVIQIQNRPDVQFPPDLMDYVHFTSSKLGIDATYSVVGIEEEWLTSNGQSILTTLYLQQVPYSTDTIVPDPWYPPVIPPVNPPTGCTMGSSYGALPSCSTGSTHGVSGCNYGASYTPPSCSTGGSYIAPPDSCLITMPSNGPDQVCGSRDLWSDNPNGCQTALMYPCYIRPGSATNKTILSIAGSLYWKDIGGDEMPAINDGWEVYAGDINGNIIAQAIKDTYTGSAGYGVRTCHFEPPANAPIAGFIIKTKGATGFTNFVENQWIYGTARYSPVNCPWNTGQKDPLLPVVAGQYYCIESANGPWFGWDEAYQQGWEESYNWEWNAFSHVHPDIDPLLNGGRMGWSGYHNSMYLSMPVGIDPNIAKMLYVEPVDVTDVSEKHTRLFFIAKTTCNQIIPIGIRESTNFGASDGSLDFYAYGVTPLGQILHFAIDSVSVYNTCPI
jgi:hypothetical protein